MGLRYYQEDAVESLFDYWQDEPGNPLIDLATGTGKSMVMATVIQRLVEGWPDMRIIVVTHVAELIEQNFLELIGVWKQAPAGIFSAGLNRRDARSQIIFAGIQTVWDKVDLICGVQDGVAERPIDVVIVEECHIIPKKSNTM